MKKKSARKGRRFAARRTAAGLKNKGKTKARSAAETAVRQHQRARLEKGTGKQRQLENNLRESEKKYRDLVEMLPQTVFEIDLQGRLTFVNRSGFSTFAFDAGDFARGIDILQALIPQDHPRARLNLQRALLGEEVSGNEYTSVRKDGSTFPAMLYTAPSMSEGRVTGLRGILIDISERKRSEDVLRISLREKEVLLKEIHHRVKNNLTIISGLLALQEVGLKDEDARKLFVNTRNRIRTMALIHEQLYKSESLARINFRIYIENLAAMLLDTFAVDPERIRVKVTMADCWFSINTAIPLALVVNELITNSIKYAFPGGSGEIRIHLSEGMRKSWSPGEPAPERIQHELIVADDGVGLPGDIDLSQPSGFGLQLVQMMIRQLNGYFFWKVDKGTELRISFFADAENE